MCKVVITVPAILVLLLQNRLFLPEVGLAGLVLAVLTLRSLCPLAHAAEEVPHPVINVAIEQGLLKVDVRNALLAEVLRVIGERAGLRVTIRGNVETLVTESFAGVPLDEGIKRLVGGQSSALLYASPSPHGEKAPLAEVWIIGGFTGGQLPAAPEEEPSEIYKQSEHVAQKSAGAGSHFHDGGQLGDKSSLAVTGPELSTRLDEVRELARQARRGEEGAIAALAEILAWEEDSVVRKRAAAALGRVKGVEVEAALAMALGDQDSSVRVRAVRGLRRLGGEMVTQALSEVVLGDSDPRVRRVAARALAALPSQAAQQALETASLDPDQLVRQTVDRALDWWETHPIARSGAAR